MNNSDTVVLGYLFGARLQFGHWSVDGRIEARRRPPCFSFPERQVEFLSTGYRTWKGWNSEHRRWMTNILYMHSRSRSYGWEWERFNVNYTVFDGLYKLAEKVAGVKAAGGHAGRYDAMQARYGLAPDYKLQPSDEKPIFSHIVHLRNNLLHQGLWDDRMPGDSGASERAWLSVEWLRRINERIIPAILGFATPFTSAPCAIDGACLL